MPRRSTEDSGRRFDRKRLTSEIANANRLCSSEEECYNHRSSQQTKVNARDVLNTEPTFLRRGFSLSYTFA